VTIVSVGQIVPGQVWYPRDGSGVPHRIIGLQQISLGEWDTDVWYEWHDVFGERHQHSKNAYVFQVRFFCPTLEQ
jgi:hypothetical protein